MLAPVPPHILELVNEHPLNKIKAQAPESFDNVALWFASMDTSSLDTLLNILRQYFYQYDTMTPLSFVKYMGGLRGQSHRYAKNKLSALKMLASKMGYAIPPHMLDSVRMSLRIQLRDGSLKIKKRDGAVTKPQLKALLALEDESGDPLLSLRNAVMIGLTWMGGFRISEVITLLRRQIQMDMSAGLIAVTLEDWKTKEDGSDDHTTYIKSLRLARMLHTLMTSIPHEHQHPEGPVFADWRKHYPKPLHYVSANNIIKRYAARIGLDDTKIRIRTHSMRRGHVSEALEDGTPVNKISAVVRMSARTIAVYQRASKNMRTSPFGDEVL